MRAMRTKVLLGVALLLSAWSGAQAGWAVGIGVGFPGYRPCCHSYGYRPYYVGFYAPAVVVAAPAPTYIVQPAPIVVQQPAAYPPPASSSASPDLETLPPPRTTFEPQTTLPAQPTPLSPAVTRAARPDDVDRTLRLLHDTREETRSAAAMQLGRDRASQAIRPLTQVLTSDNSPRVREAAARALGLIAGSEALTALQNAAMADDDREVRSSARFAAEVIRGNLSRR